MVLYKIWRGLNIFSWLIMLRRTSFACFGILWNSDDEKKTFGNTTTVDDTFNGPYTCNRFDDIHVSNVKNTFF